MDNIHQLTYRFQQRTINVTDWTPDAMGMLSKTYSCMKCNKSVTIQITQYMRTRDGIVQSKEDEAMHALVSQGCNHIAVEPLEYGGQDTQRASSQ